MYEAQVLDEARPVFGLGLRLLLLLLLSLLLCLLLLLLLLCLSTGVLVQGVRLAVITV